MIPLPSAFKILEKTPQKLLFEFHPLYPGYGVTIGNALRRVLLSSIEGAAITKVQIKNVPHEFSNIPGVKEDLLEICLNLKQVRLRMFTDSPQEIVLKKQGKGKVKVGDIKAPSEVEIVNKNLQIATLTSSSAKIEMAMEVKKGFGYARSEELQPDLARPGEIFLDAIFSPVKKVAFWVQDIRFKERTDYNKLKMEIETDETMEAIGALKEGLDILIKHFQDVSKQIEPILPKKVLRQPSIEKLSLEDLSLSTRTKNALLGSGIKSLSGLLKKNEESLKNLPGLGEKGIEEIKKVLKKKGLELKME